MRPHCVHAARFARNRYSSAVWGRVGDCFWCWYDEFPMYPNPTNIPANKIPNECSSNSFVTCQMKRNETESKQNPIEMVADLGLL